MDRRSLAFCTVTLAAVMDLFDGAATNIAFPSIQRDLGMSGAMMTAVVTSSSLALGALLAVGGRLGDRYGHRRMLAVGTVGFAVASAFCACATNGAWLVASRGAQGVAAAVMVPQTLAAVQLLYPADGRARALGVYASVTGLAVASAPPLGAVLTEALGWRSVFWVCVPVAAVVLLGLRTMPADAGRDGDGFDVGGACLLTCGLLALVVPLLLGNELDWPTWLLALAAGAPVAAVLLVRHERRRRGTRLVDPALFRFRSFTGSLLVMVFVFAGVYAFFFTLAVHLQRGLGWTPLQSALVVLPWSAAIPLASAVASRLLVHRHGRRGLVTGLTLMVAGIGSLAVVPDATLWTFGPPLFVAGLGMGFVSASILGLGLADVPGKDAGSASGVLNNVQQVGGSIGMAGLGAVYFAHQDTFALTVLGVAVLFACAIPATRLLPIAL